MNKCGGCGQSVQFDMEDLLEQANEVQEMLGRSYAVPDELDEADLEAGAPRRVLI
jgi:charged multivesicular body protein 5